MDWLIGSIFTGFVFWVKSLPHWGIALIIVGFGVISSNFGPVIEIACGIIIWNVFGMGWGLFFFGVSALFFIIPLALVALNRAK